MHAVADTGSIIYSARNVDGGEGSRVTATEQRSPHMFPHRSAGPCTRYLSAKPSPVATTRQAIAARNVARYSES